jgi:hypothetical protein
MNRFVILTLVARALLAVGFPTAALADQKLPNRLNQVAQPWPEAVVIIKSRPVGESEATKANNVFKPPIFAERNRIEAPKPIFTLEPAKSAIADPAVGYKKAADTQEIVRETVRSRVSHMEKVRVRSRRTSSASWKNEVWGLPN